MKMKKLLCGILSAAFTLSAFTSSAFASSYNDVPNDAVYAEAVEAISLYGIVSGYGGYFNPDAAISRAEFSKIASIVSGNEDAASGLSGIKKFSDVDVNFWGNGYINTVSNNGLIIGYPNGEFRPNNNINLAEAVTVTLRMLGYGTDVLGDNWPYSYLVKAASLGLTENISKDAYSSVSRGEVAMIIYKALQTDINNTSDKLLTKLDIKESKETYVIATKNEDKSLSANQIKTDIGTYELKNTNIDIPVLSKVKLILDKDDKVINMVTVYTPRLERIVVDSVLSGGVAYMDGISYKTMSIDDNTKVYFNGKESVYSDITTMLETGSTLDMYYGEDGEIDYIRFTEAELSDPVVIGDNVYDSLALIGVTKDTANSLSVVRDGKAVKISDLRQFDVVYYSKELSTLYAYCDKISGVYQEAYPSKANVNSIKLSDVTLNIETQTAAYKLGEKGGSYALNSKLTALLGRKGEIVDVVDLNSADVSSYGVLLSATTEVSQDIDDKGTMIKYVTLLMGNGTEMKYKTNEDYTKQAGEVKHIYFEDDGTVKLEKVSTDTVSGAIDLNNSKIGDSWLTSDAKIIEILSRPEYGEEGAATAKVIELSDFGVDSLNRDNVVHAVKNGQFGDVSLLVVQNITNAGYIYGVLTKSNSNIGQMSASSTFEILSDGKIQTYNYNAAKNIASGIGVRYKLSGGSIDEISALVKVDYSGKCEAIDFTRIRMGNNTYKLASDVQIYKKSDTYEYTAVSVNDCTADMMKNARLYADKPTTNGGLIRVIIVDK